jgi:predicted amidophosphoribosyltransferase
MNNRTINYLSRLLGKIIDIVADILIPKENQVKLLEELGPNGLFESIPRSDNFDLPTQAGFDTSKIKAIFNYKTVLCRQAIWEIKYRANNKLIRDFSLLLYEFILDELSDLDTFDNFKKPILIPIPSSPTRTREKGFNQCLLITRELIKIDKERKGNNFTSLENFLIKKIDTPHQARVSNRKKRLGNIKNTFSINESGWPDIRNNSLRLTKTNHCESFSDIRPIKLSEYSFIIIDDVITTGATMHEAFRTLKSVGIKKIRGFALAH